MDVFKEEQFATLHIGHLGLIADKIDSLNLVNLIDRRLPITPGCGYKVSHGERVAAMILNGLGFIDSRLYLVPEFLSDKPLDRLFNRPMLAEWFNDDASGRCLDAISEYVCLPRLLRLKNIKARGVQKQESYLKQLDIKLNIR